MNLQKSCGTSDNNFKMPLLRGSILYFKTKYNLSSYSKGRKSYKWWITATVNQHWRSLSSIDYNCQENLFKIYSLVDINFENSVLWKYVFFNVNAQVIKYKWINDDKN